VGVVKTSQQRNNTGASIREAGQQDRNLFAMFSMMFLFLMMPYMLKGFFLEIKMNFSDCIKWSEVQHGTAPFDQNLRNSRNDSA
jgi:hypothetical protein